MDIVKHDLKLKVVNSKVQNLITRKTYCSISNINSDKQNYHEQKF